MTTFKLLPAAILSLFFLQATSQSTPPKGYKQGSITLADSTILSGYIKDNIRGNAAVTILTESTGKKQNYNGADLRSVTIEQTQFLCIKGDFFRIICQGDLYFLQKASDASGKPTYNGAEAVFTSGTEGKPSDYFIYDKQQKELKLVSKKNVDAVVASSFAGNAAAIEKAKNINGDIALLKDAVDVFNNHTTVK
jgi:hypothetical protein